jgi:predicted O-methyltransferase YrrM
LRRWLERLPFLIPLGKQIRQLGQQRDRSISQPERAAVARRAIARLKTVESARAAEVALALEDYQRGFLEKFDKVWVARIEAQRLRLLAKHTPLVDGSEGPGGLHDGNRTISSACAASKGPQAALLLYLLVRKLRPRNVLELGTNVGISSAYVAAALCENGEGGRVCTLESSPYRQRLARQLHAEVGVTGVEFTTGLFAESLPRVLANDGPFDFAFIDGHHQYQPTLDYFDAIFETSSADGVFVFDDIRWSKGMERAWRELCADPRLGVAIDLHSLGIGVRATSDGQPRFVTEPIRLSARRRGQKYGEWSKALKHLKEADHRYRVAFKTNQNVEAAKLDLDKAQAEYDKISEEIGHTLGE